MPTARLTIVRKADGTERQIVEIFRGEDVMESPALEEGEAIEATLQGSTWSNHLSGSTEPSTDDELKAEILAVYDAHKRGESTPFHIA